MDDRIQKFVARDSWMFVAIVTLPLAGLAATAGLGALTAAITLVGWFLLTPVLLFWGGEVAVLLGGDDATGSTGEGDAKSDPLETLKRRYAAGEIDDAEFERRLERLVAVDEIADDAVVHGDSRLRSTDTLEDESAEFDRELRR